MTAWVERNVLQAENEEYVSPIALKLPAVLAACSQHRGH
jgi:hypothetical protein